MNELINVQMDGNLEPILSGRDLHEFLGVKEKYTQWFERMAEYGFLEGVDFQTSDELSEKTEGSRLVKRKVINHHLKIDMAKEISMIQRTDRGKQARQYFIAVEKAWNTPEQVMARRVYEFNRYLKAITKADKHAYPNIYSLDERAIAFLREIECDDIIETDNLAWFIKTKNWDMIYQKHMDVFRAWIASDKEAILDALNTEIFMQDWEKYAKGTISAWEMEVLCFYYHEHELANIDNDKYGFADFYCLPEEPIIEKIYRRDGKEIPIFKLHRICGTCIAKNKVKSMVTILTTTGVVNVKFRKEYFTMFDKQISERQDDGVKKIMEKSWFNRGSMIVVTGIRSGDDFIAKKYVSTETHQLYKINEIIDGTDIVLTHERYHGEME